VRRRGHRRHRLHRRRRPTELYYNARIAANLGAPALLVVSGHDRSPEEIRQVAEVAIAELQTNHAQVIGVVAKPLRRRPGCTDPHRTGRSGAGLDDPEEPFLVAPTVRALMEAVGGRLVVGEEELLSREAGEVLVGAMSFEHLLDRLSDGAVVITPGDRSDILLGVLTAHAAASFPSLAGIILTAGTTRRSRWRAWSSPWATACRSCGPTWARTAPRARHRAPAAA